MKFFLDLETIPSQNPDVRNEITANIRPPGNMKKAETIAKWEVEERQDAIEEAYLKTSFDGARGEIICMAWVVENDPVPDGIWRDFMASGSEKAMLQGFFQALTEARERDNGRAPHFIGHNVKDFDLRFIFHRAVILGVKPPCHLPHDARGNGDLVFDTMLAWAGWGNRVKLNALCHALGIPGKPDGIDGGKVWPMVKDGRIAEVMEYCKNDVVSTREVYKRMMFEETIRG